jgi:hypothetical protein
MHLICLCLAWRLRQATQSRFDLKDKVSKPVRDNNDIWVSYLPNLGICNICIARQAAAKNSAKTQGRTSRPTAHTVTPSIRLLDMQTETELRPPKPHPKSKGQPYLPDGKVAASYRRT